MFGDFLCQAIERGLRVVAFGVQRTTGVGVDLRQLFFGLRDAGARRLDQVSLGDQFLFLLDSFPPFLRAHQGAGEAVADALLVGHLLLAVVRQNGCQAHSDLFGGGQIAPCPVQSRALLVKCCFDCPSVRLVVGGNLQRQRRRIVGLDAEGRTAEFGVGAP